VHLSSAQFKEPEEKIEASKTIFPLCEEKLLHKVKLMCGTKTVYYNFRVHVPHHFQAPERVSPLPFFPRPSILKVTCMGLHLTNERLQHKKMGRNNVMNVHLFNQRFFSCAYFFYLQFESAIRIYIL
jgi:hypothetical protein